jgi:hypothetical protein
MLPLFNVCVNERASAYIQTLPGIHGHIPCQFHADSGAEGNAPFHRSPWGPVAHGLPILKSTGEANQLFKKALGAKELSRIEAPWGTPNYELERRR